MTVTRFPSSSSSFVVDARYVPFRRGLLSCRHRFFAERPGARGQSLYLTGTRDVPQPISGAVTVLFVAPSGPEGFQKVVVSA
jgi:hypothetical protein